MCVCLQWSGFFCTSKVSLSEDTTALLLWQAIKPGYMYNTVTGNNPGPSEGIIELYYTLCVCVQCSWVNCSSTCSDMYVFWVYFSHNKHSFFSIVSFTIIHQCYSFPWRRFTVFCSLFYTLQSISCLRFFTLRLPWGISLVSLLWAISV